MIDELLPSKMFIYSYNRRTNRAKLFAYYFNFENMFFNSKHLLSIILTFPFIYESIGLREDEPCEVLSQEEVLMNAKDTCDNQIRVKKVI